MRAPARALDAGSRVLSPGAPARGVAASARAALGAAADALRRPRVVVAEVLALGAASALAAALPQEPAADELRRFAEQAPALARWTAALGLHEIVTSAWFVAIATVCLLSLLAVQVRQWPRLVRTWPVRRDPAAFARAHFRREAAARPDLVPRFLASGRVALVGSPLFHLGLLVLVAAGLVRMLTFRDAVGRVLEGESLPAAPGAFEAERGGRLSRPLVLPERVRVEGVREERYGSGALRQVAVALAPDGAPERDLAVNAPVDVGDVRLHVGNAHGIAALLELARPGAAPEPIVAFLEERAGEWRAAVRPGPDLELRIRAARGGRAEAVDVRVLRDGLLAGMAELAPGSELDLGGGTALRLRGLPWWAQLRGSRDPSRPLFFAGAVIALAGMVLMFGFNRVDTAVFVDGGRVVVALRAQRFAPLYADRFERLCREWLP